MCLYEDNSISGLERLIFPPVDREFLISDASPIHYLALIGETQVLPALYAKVIIPQKVYDEIRQPQTPAIVRSFANALPPWVEVRAISSPIDESLLTLDRGEQEAITLALEMKADASLIDESNGSDAARLGLDRRFGHFSSRINTPFSAKF